MDGWKEERLYGVVDGKIAEWMKTEILGAHRAKYIYISYISIKT
jgi:hypothetical protein